MQKYDLFRFEEKHAPDESYVVYEIPQQLQHENIKIILQNWGGVSVIVDDTNCREKMLKFRSTAQKMAKRVFNGNFYFSKQKLRRAYTETKKITVELLLQTEDFSLDKEFIEAEILPNWEINDFIQFFVFIVTRIKTTRQILGYHRKTQQKRFEKNKSYHYTKALARQISVKQEFRQMANHFERFKDSILLR